jgi:DNA-binding response OmpR family regulator
MPDAILVRQAIQKENLPIDIQSATDGEQALDFILRAESNPDAPTFHVILLDLNLPKIDGIELLRRLRAGKKYQNIPVLVVTSSDSPSDRNEAAGLGAVYFRKPPAYAEFMKVGPALRRLLEDRGLL